MEHIPKSEGKDTILAVVDRFIKYNHFISLKHPFTAQGVACIYIDTIHRLHGIMQILVLYRDKIFTILFWQELMHAIVTKLHLSLAYHPQTDGQAEWLNQCL